MFQTAIKAASYLGDARVLKLLLDCGAEADYCTSSSPTFVWAAGCVFVCVLIARRTLQPLDSPAPRSA